MTTLDIITIINRNSDNFNFPPILKKCKQIYNDESQWQKNKLSLVLNVSIQ